MPLAPKYRDVLLVKFMSVWLIAILPFSHSHRGAVVTLRRHKNEPLIIKDDEDVRENIIRYDDEGGGKTQRL